MKRAGLFGGTFNPVHFGHLRPALEVRMGFGLDTLYFIPSANPPHKKNGRLLPGADRLEMLSRAISGTDGFRISEVEFERSGRSYTVDTVEQMKIELPGTECFLIVGLDAFLEIDTWKAYLQLFEQISFIVMSRPVTDEKWGGVSDYIKTSVSSEYSFNADRNCFFHPRLYPVYLFEVTPLGISATRIRQFVRENYPVRYLLPEQVAEYIYEQRLYV